MSQIMGLLLAPLLALPILFSQTSMAAPSECTGCQEVRAVEQELKQLRNDGLANREERHLELLGKASSAIAATAPGAKKTLNAEQITAVTALLRVSIPDDPVYSVVDNNTELFEANHKGFLAEIKKLRAKEADLLSSAIGITIGQKEGQDPRAKGGPRHR